MTPPDATCRRENSLAHARVMEGVYTVPYHYLISAARAANEPGGVIRAPTASCRHALTWMGEGNNNLPREVGPRSLPHTLLATKIAQVLQASGVSHTPAHPDNTQ